MKHRVNKPAASTDPARSQVKAVQQDTTDIGMEISGEPTTPLKPDDPTLTPTPNRPAPAEGAASLVTDATPDTSGKNAEASGIADSGAEAGVSMPESQVAGLAGASISHQLSPKPCSPKKQASNARNSKLFSTGPKTPAGKKKSAMNALKHGTYARHLFATAAQWAADGQDYQIRAAAIRDTYRPKNAVVELWVEKLAGDMTVLVRVIRHEQAVLSSDYPFEGPRIERILRCKAAAERAVYRDIEALQRFQEEGNLTREQPASFESDPGNDGGKAGAPSSELTVDSGEPAHGAVEEDGESTLPEGSENHPDSGAEVRQASETVIYQRPPDLPDLPQTTVPVITPRERSKNLERIDTILEGFRFKE